MKKNSERLECDPCEHLCESNQKNISLLLIFLLKSIPCWLTTAKLHHWGHTNNLRCYIWRIARFSNPCALISIKNSLVLICSPHVLAKNKILIIQPTKVCLPYTHHYNPLLIINLSFRSKNEEFPYSAHKLSVILTTLQYKLQWKME